MNRTIDLLIHEAPLRAEALRLHLGSALEGLPPTAAEPMLARLQPAQHRVPNLVLTGLHSGGKSMLIKALTDGAAEVVIDADIATDVVTSYTWDGAVTLVDTPGVHAGIDAHDEKALSALKGADLVLFVITPDLFDDSSAQHLRLVADGLGKREQLMVVVNKAQTMVADPGVRHRALAKVLGGGELPPLLECDAKSYVTSLTAEDARLSVHLRATSGIDALREQINAFSAERGDLAMLRQPFQLIRSTAAEAEAALVEDPQERAVTTWLSRVRRTLSQHEQDLGVRLATERGTFLRGALDLAESFADACDALDGPGRQEWQGGFDAAATQLSSGLNLLAERTSGRMVDLVGQAFQGLTDEMREIDEGPQAALIRSFSTSPKPMPRSGARLNLRARRPAAGSQHHTSATLRNAQGLLREFQNVWGAGHGVKASAGSMGHTVTKNVGSLLGKKWKPWESVRLANNIGRAARVVGVALQVGLSVYEVYAEEQRALSEERARAARRRLIVTEVLGEAESHIDGVIREIRKVTDEPFQGAYQQIDEQWDEIARNRTSQSDLRDELRAIQDECARMTTLLSRANAPGAGPSVEGAVVP